MTPKETITLKISEGDIIKIESPTETKTYFVVFKDFKIILRELAGEEDRILRHLRKVI